MRGVAIVIFCAAIGFAVAVIVRVPAVGGQLFTAGTRASRDAVNVSAPLTVEQVAAKVLPSVVTLETKAGDESEMGSGIVLTSDGLIMTNNHVVAPIHAGPPESASHVVTFYDGRTAVFGVVATDPTSDVAVVRAQGISGLVPVLVGRSAGLHVGQPVAAVGSPLGLQNTLSTGVISALNRAVVTAADADNQLAAFDAIQTDAALNPGSSGGALVDMERRTHRHEFGDRSSGWRTAGGPEWFDRNWFRHSRSTTPAASRANSSPAVGQRMVGWAAGVGDDPNNRGARIIGVTDGSPAAAAGLPIGSVITKVDDHVTGSANALVAAVRSRAPGTQINLGCIEPSGVSRTVAVTLGSDQGQD